MPRSSFLLPVLVLFGFILLSAALRPVLPPDETRYLTVAWEMLVRGNYLVPTVNFAPYTHKPPLLFWSIDLVWAVFGVSRLAALAVVFAVSTLAIVLTGLLARELKPGEEAVRARVPWAMVGNVVFVIYCGLILFDLLLTSCILGALLAFLARTRSAGGKAAWRLPALMGLCIGLGVLAKGPVVLVFVLWPVATYPLWRGSRRTLSTGAVWKVTGLALLVALVPVALWVGPAVVETGGAFARMLIVEQTAGRISGEMQNSHDRPFWFYLPLLPVFALPWLLSPVVWQANRPSWPTTRAAARALWRSSEALRFLALWIVPVVVTFSLIGGKQPHYLVPLLPAVVLGSAFAMKDISFRLIRIGAAIPLVLALAFETVASFTLFTGYDLEPLATVIAEHRGPVAFMGDYEGDFGFLGRLTRPLELVADDRVAQWLADHPDGMVAAVWLREDQRLPGRTIYRAPYELHRFMAASVAAKSP